MDLLHELQNIFRCQPKDESLEKSLNAHLVQRVDARHGIQELINCPSIYESLRAS